MITRSCRVACDRSSAARVIVAALLTGFLIVLADAGPVGANVAVGAGEVPGSVLATERTADPAYTYDYREDFARPPPAEVVALAYENPTHVLNPAADGGRVLRAILGAEVRGVATRATGAADDVVGGVPDAARTRPSFRKGTEVGALDDAPRAVDGGAMCPGCDTPIGRGQIDYGGRMRRDFDLDHFGASDGSITSGTWAERVRNMPSDITRPEVIDAYQEMVRATCPICNQSHVLEGL